MVNRYYQLLSHFVPKTHFKCWFENHLKLMGALSFILTKSLLVTVTTGRVLPIWVDKLDLQTRPILPSIERLEGGGIPQSGENSLQRISWHVTSRREPLISVKRREKGQLPAETPGRK